jgi:general secretion pathway protein J
MIRGKRVRGFTLVEILVAVAIFAVMSVMAYRGLDTALKGRERITEENRKWRELSQFFGRLENDFANLNARSVRGTSGSNVLAPVLARTNSLNANEPPLSFTRAGLPGSDGTLAAPQRFGYRLRENAVELLLWPVLDQGTRTEPKPYKLLGDVNELAFRFMDQRGQWLDAWPQPQTSAQQQTQTPLPRAIEVTITLASGERDPWRELILQRNKKVSQSSSRC